jgi:hypothetical protein
MITSSSHSHSHSRSGSPYISEDDESVLVSVNPNRSLSSSEDSLRTKNNTTPKKSLNVKRQDKVTNVAGLLSDDIGHEHIAKKLNADQNTRMQFASGMTKEEFINRAQELGLTRQEAKQLTANLELYIEALQNPDVDKYSHAEQQLKVAEKLPAKESLRKLLATNMTAGATGYLTSFFWGKLFSSLSVLLGGSRGAWVFPLVAGPLNVLLSEPVVGAIKMQGAFHPSPDGAAYTDYNTASARLAKANYLNDTDAINHWTLAIAKIVDSVIDREQKHPTMWFRSGVEKPERNEHGYVLDADGGVDKKFDELTEKVISGARIRSFMSDEMPFTHYLVNYLLSGAMQPFWQQTFSPPVAMAIDVSLSAFLGMLSGAQTGLTQDLMREFIQKAPLKDLSINIKGAKMAIAAAKRDECLDRLNKVKACEAILAEKLLKIKAHANTSDSEFDDRIKKAEDELSMAKAMRKTIDREYAKARRKHDLHAARHHRCGTAVGIAVNSYLGEKSDPPQPLQGRRAINRVIAKALATPLALVFTPLYTSVFIPAVLHAASSRTSPFDIAANQPMPGYNFTSNENETWQSLNAAATTKHQHDMLMLSMTLNALSGIPLIVGYICRNQYIAPVIEKGIAYLEALRGSRNTNNNSESDIISSNHRTSLDESVEVSPPSSDDSEDTDNENIVRSSTQNRNEETSSLV